MEAPFPRTFGLFIILLEMSYFRSARAFSFLRSQSLIKSRYIFSSSTTNGMHMTSERGTSHGSKFEAWYQKTVQTLSLNEELIPIPLDIEFSSNFGSIGKSNVTFVSKAWQSKSMRYIRLISFVGEGYDVFNFMALPRSNLDVPILGIDVVSLPSEFSMSLHCCMVQRQIRMNWFCMCSDSSEETFIARTADCFC